jgi:two-component system, chemotaxis family, response regulator Rcp1
MRKSVFLLMVDDNPADVVLAREALAGSSIRSQITACADGEEALALLHKEGRYTEAASPDLMILDLNLPRKDGLSVLAAMKSDPELKHIPVVIFSTSRLGKDIARSYAFGANCYVSKPGNLNDFFSAMKSIHEFWCGTVCLPPQGE